MDVIGLGAVVPGPEPLVWHRPSWHRALGLAAALLLVLVGAQGWAPRVLDRPASTAPADDAAGLERAGVDPRAVAEEVGHRLRPSGDGFVVQDRAYEARFDADGFSYRPSGSDHALRLSLTGVARGSAGVRLDDGAVWTGTGHVAERVVAPGTTERVTARAGEVEWDVVLGSAAAVPGAGDLVVTAGLAGTTGVAAPTADGSSRRVVLRDGTEVLLGEVVVKDASGTVLHRGLPAVTGGEVSLRVPGDVLDGAEYPVTVDPTVSGATTVDGPGWQYDPDVAFDGTNYFVVWRDNRGSGEDIFGARVSGSGSLLDPTGIPIATDARNQFQPAVAWNGSVFLVVWEHRHTDADPDVRGKRVSSSGALVATTPTDTGIPVSVFLHKEQFPDVAASGSDFLVVWQDNRTAGNANDIYGARVTTDGNVRDSALAIGAETRDQTVPAVAWNGSTWLVAWTRWWTSTDPDIHASRVTPAGGVLPGGAGTAVATPTSGQSWPSVASDGSQFLVVWDDDRNYFPDELDVFGSRVAGDGSVLDGQGLKIAGGDGFQWKAFVDFNGVFLVTHAGLRGIRVRGDGAVLDTPGFPISNDAGGGWPGIVRGPGDDWGVVYTNGGGPTGTLFLRRVSAK